MRQLDIRDLSPTDLSACAEIFNDAWNDLHRRHGFEEDEANDADDAWLTRPLTHFLDTDPHGGRIALDDQGPLAFASSLGRDDIWYLSYLFVHPRAQGRGVGRALLRELLPDDEGAVRACEVESFQSVATALYVSVGRHPCAVRYYLNGPPNAGRLPPRDSAMSRAPMTPDDLADVEALDARLLGFRRSEDHKWWLGRMTGQVYRRGGEMVGYAYVDDGWIAPALAVDEATLSAIVADVLRSSDDPSAVRSVASSYPLRRPLPPAPGS
jgi:GNAT superfamily N-acetyltransferase